jgi:hypothetical protein
MSPITHSVPIYEGLLALAAPEEREALIQSGVRQRPRTPIYESDEDTKRANAGYRTVRVILARAVNDGTLRFTGIDPRATPPRRQNIEGEVVLTGRLRWSKRPGVESTLDLSWTNPSVVIVNLRIEPKEESRAESQAPMSPPKRLSPGERIDDSTRLHRMQEIIDEGNQPKTAARRAAVEMPSPHTSEDSLVTRLMRKFKKLSKA